MKPTAQAVGSCTKKGRSPVGAKASNLLPDVPFVIRNLVLLEERHKLFLKRPRPMMLLLVRDISTDRSHIRFANAKRPIPGLPGETGFPLSSRPPRRVRLNHPHHVGHALGWTNANQHMDVIGSAIDDERRSAELSDNAPKVCEKIVSDFGSDYGRIFRTVARYTIFALFARSGAFPHISVSNHGGRNNRDWSQKIADRSRTGHPDLRLAAKRRQNEAHGASRGSERQMTEPQRGERIFLCGVGALAREKPGASQQPAHIWNVMNSLPPNYFYM